MAKITIVSENGEVDESEMFAAVTFEREGEMIYSSSYVALSKLPVSALPALAVSIADILTRVLGDIVIASGIDLLDERVEPLDLDKGKEKDNGKEEDNEEDNKGG